MLRFATLVPNIRSLFATVLLLAMLSGHATAEPISIRGVNWAMSEAEQVSVLENQNLACVKDAGWQEIFGPTSDKLGKSPDIHCIKGDARQNTISQLRTYFQENVRICDILDGGYLSANCMKYDKFRSLKKSTLAVSIRNDGTIVFDCSFVGTCGFDVETVVIELRKKVIAKDFRKPTKDAWVICANGDNGDSICVHSQQRDIWLLKTPLSERMKF